MKTSKLRLDSSVVDLLYLIITSGSYITENTMDGMNVLAGNGYQLPYQPVMISTRDGSRDVQISMSAGIL